MLHNRGMVTHRTMVMPDILKILSPILGAALLVGCAADSTRYPSLATRPNEPSFDPVTGQFTPSGAAIDAVASAPIRPVATSADIAGVVAQAEAAHQRFAQREPIVNGLVGRARGLGIESDARARALVAIADLTSLRSDTAIALADLDMLVAQAATTFAPTEEVNAARALVLDLMERQSASLAQLQAEMER